MKALPAEPPSRCFQPAINSAEIHHPPIWQGDFLTILDIQRNFGNASHCSLPKNQLPFP
jgi:hypothetical protein